MAPPPAVSTISTQLNFGLPNATNTATANFTEETRNTDIYIQSMSKGGSKLENMSMRLMKVAGYNWIILNMNDIKVSPLIQRT